METRSSKMREMTEANLSAAFAGESQAHMKYLIFADKAERDGFSSVARLFQAIAFAERVHATNHLRELRRVEGTAANLAAAIGGEHYENTEMYPAFNVVADLQAEKGAMRSIQYALEAEKVHELLFGDALTGVEQGEDMAAAPVYVCPVCGHTEIGEPEGQCPVCGLKVEKFHRF
jgi:rubrerythrin